MKNKVTKSIYNISKLKLILIIFFVFTIILPIFKMMCNIKLENISGLFSDLMFKNAILNSLYTSSITTILSVSIAFILAYAIKRSNIKFKNIFIIIFTAPMLIPSISHGIGIINLFGSNGILTNMLKMDVNIYGPLGIILGGVLYSFPVAFLILHDGFSYIDDSVYETCEVLGIKKINAFFKFTMYYLKKPLLSCLFAVFTLVFTDYGIGLAVGGRYITLPVYLYKEVIGLLDFSKGAIIGFILLIPAVVSFVFDLIKKDNSYVNYSSVKKIQNNKGINFLLTVCSILVSVVILAIISSFIVLSITKNYGYNNTITFEHFNTIFKSNILKNIINSVVIALATSAIGTVLSYICAYFTARVESKLNKLLHILSLISMSIPGIVLGLGFILLYKGSIIYGTLFILILVNIVHFFASPYLMAYNALNKMNKNYELIGMVHGISRMKILLDILIPETKSTIAEMFGYFFVNSMITISAVAFLFTFNTMPASLLISEYEGQLMQELAAVVSILILGINVLYKIISLIVVKIKVNNDLLGG